MDWSNSNDRFQPNPGWGDICCTCKHVFLEKENISFPCYKVNNFLFKNMYMPQLIRYATGIEICDEYERLDELSDTKE